MGRKNWLRPHTRPDWSHRIASIAGCGIERPLRARQPPASPAIKNVEADLLRAGHPELIFELDGQAVDGTQDWHKSVDSPGPQAWLVAKRGVARDELGNCAEKNRPLKACPGAGRRCSGF